MRQKWKPVKGGTGPLVIALFFLLILNPFFLLLAIVFVSMVIFNNTDISDWERMVLIFILIVLFFLLFQCLSW